ncbi:MAG: ribosome assembly RNA-binding protein YhbY [Gammaproteobacteria bacterium]
MLNKDQKKYLRSLLHSRNIIIWIGQNGLSENILDEIEAALNHHELVKIRIRTGDSKDRDKLAELICSKTGAEVIHKIGGTVSVYRANTDNPAISFP